MVIFFKKNNKKTLQKQHKQGTLQDLKNNYYHSFNNS